MSILRFQGRPRRALAEVPIPEGLVQTLQPEIHGRLVHFFLDFTIVEGLIMPPADRWSMKMRDRGEIMGRTTKRGTRARLAGVLLLGLLGTYRAAMAEEGLGPGAEQAQLLSRAFRFAAKRVAPAVVTVVTKINRYQQYVQNGRIYERLVPEDGSIGSGVIIHNTGVVLTNSHVLEGADDVVVRTADGQEFATFDLRRDPLSDVAILRIKAPGTLTVAKLGDSDKLEIGDWVVAIGSPFELEATVSAGIISGKNRTLEKIGRGKLLQTDAAINPGNSGGPLVNLEGEVIGLNTAIASSSGGYQGIGFAIPINNARWVVNQLASQGKVTRGYLGIGIGELLPREAAAKGLPPVAGVIVTKVTPNTSADQAGLLVDDIILEFAGTRVRDRRDLQGIVERKDIGSRHPLKIYRDGREQDISIEVQTPPREMDL